MLKMWIAPLVAFSLYLDCTAMPVRIVGSAQYDLVNYFDGSTRTVASSQLTILVDGLKYRILTKAAPEGATAPVGFEGVDEDYGCDGMDTFLVTERPTIANRGAGLGGIIFPGRFPERCSALVQTAWLGYCSQGYFQNPEHHTNLDLSYVLTWVLPQNVTNIVQDWPGTELPKQITGWSRNIVKLHGQEELLKQYPHGFKQWKFVATNEIQISGVYFPQLLVLEGFVPRPPQDATSGEETALTRRITFVATSIKEETTDFDPLPVIPSNNLPVLEKRFQGQIGTDVQLTHLSPTNGWPTRSSPSFRLLEARAAELQSYNLHSIPQPMRTAIIVFIFAAGNVLVFSFLFKHSRSAKSNKLNELKTKEQI